jgi:tRNA threonylcarbamoyladenosine biosynthesis protein TsaB
VRVSKNILAIETSANVGAVCVLRGDDVVNEVVRDDAKLSAWIVPAIDRALRRADTTLDDVDAIAFGSGPGSFTGVRTACATAQALAYARATPLFAVSSLQSLAVSALSVNAHLNRAANTIKVILDARMNEAFSAVLSGRSALELEFVQAASVTPMTSIEFSANDAVLGSGAIIIAERLGVSIQRIDEIRALTYEAETRWAEAAARIALKRLSAGAAPLDPMDATPEYVRNNVAQTEAERRALHAAEVRAA